MVSRVKQNKKIGLYLAFFGVGIAAIAFDVLKGFDGLVAGYGGVLMAVATIGAAFGDVNLAAKRYGAVAAFAGF